MQTQDGKSTPVKFPFDDALWGLGDSTITVTGDVATLNGTLGTKSYAQVAELLKDHPNVKTLVLGAVPGSVNDDVNMHTGRLVRNAGLTTKVLDTSEIASGGVDLFAAGQRRIVEDGARIGVHSWCCVSDLTAIELPEEHPAHGAQLAYFTEILGAERGPEFYFYTLRSAEFDDIHWMSATEIQTWGLATE